MNKILIILFLSFFVSCFSQKKNTIPKNFKEYTIPESYSKEWYELNRSSIDYSVKIVQGKLVVNKIKPVSGSELKFKNGKLIGKNHGEWGGELIFESTDNEIIKIKSGNIVKIFEFKNKIYFIEGLAHLSISKGTLYELKDNFDYIKLFDFDDAPEAIEVTKDKIYIASHKNFYTIENMNKSKVFENKFWTSLYPNSIAILDDENIFIGMRSGITKLNLKSKEINFYREN
ncbi:hypothetical protein [Elizabethkingia sp. JS20170427COW]|uniref:hypothetical protein n=1 Tax=Elizabethkingia sp. JS20170427COW TaxID=2583851 RepID=UPI001110DE17|nr:hypothetical protein [Elizabethkingia sp. JS20170427COW]QCX52240.1 hypothetical protein FGE20_00010 [Elizabethkingia sp. JS20170427COW]